MSDANDVRKVVHLTSAHPPWDSRIYYKECLSLHEAGYDVTLLAPWDGKVPEGPVRVHCIAKPKNRTVRFSWTLASLGRAAIAERADIYHFHDPDLLPVGLLLRALGKRVVYDIHEDLPKDVYYKQWLPARLRPLLAVAAGFGERAGIRALSAAVAATPSIAQRFPVGRVEVVQNFPRPEEIRNSGGVPYRQRPPTLAYIGGLTRERGLFTMLDALDASKTPGIELVLAGRFPYIQDQRSAESHSNWRRISFLGWQDRSAIAALLGRSRIGLVTLHPQPGFMESFPIKMFEYMAAGIPVIATDIPLWREIVEGCGCGMVVNPHDTAAVAAAIDRLLGDPVTAQVMGERGRRAIESKYNWGTQEKKLLKLYRELLDAESRVE